MVAIRDTPSSERAYYAMMRWYLSKIMAKIAMPCRAIGHSGPDRALTLSGIWGRKIVKVAGIRRAPARY